MISNWDKKCLLWSLSGAEIFSTCSKAQYMAIVVDINRRILGSGYNGVPSGMTHCSDGGCPRVVNNVPSGTPYDYGDGLCYAIHAEANALLHSDRSARVGGTIYIGGAPCFGCAKLIAGSGLSRVVFVGNQSSREDWDQSISVLEHSGLTVEVVHMNDLFKE
jgi:dCMP deaminase